MSTETTHATKTQVVLLRLGVGRQEFELPPGSTLADLLREAHADANDQQVMVDGRTLQESVVLEPGMIVSVVPRPQTGPSGDWRATVGMFRGDATFREIVDAVEASREAEKDRS